MTVRCDQCGLESTQEAAFHRFAITRQRSRLYCPACWHEQQTARHATLLVLALLAGLVGLFFWYWGGQNLNVWILIAGFLYILFQILCVLPHELGHALAAWLTDMRVFTVCIGFYGRLLFSIPILGPDFAMRSVPFGGYTLKAPRSTRFFRTRYFFVVLCGPLVNLALLLVAFQVRWQLRSSEELAWVIDIFIVCNLMVLAVNLWPRKFSIPPWPELRTDGLALLTIPFMPQQQVDDWHAAWFYLEGLESRERKKPWAETIGWFEEGLKHYPRSYFNHFGLALALTDQRSFAEARHEYLQAIEYASSPQYGPYAWNNLALVDLMIGSPEALDEADRFSRQAYECIPWEPDVKGTRGGVLVEQGRLDDGICLLETALAKSEKAHDRAIHACWLAIAKARQGDPSAADHYLDQARRLDPSCPLLTRAQQETNSVIETESTQRTQRTQSDEEQV
jgi:Tfp pilus assembly protein PilF